MNSDNESVFYIHRHGLRLDIHDNNTNSNNWETSDRFKEHCNDMPLADPEEYGIQLNAYLIKEDIDVIYTSPATRCIETAIILQESMSKTHNKIIPIYVEYGLMEVKNHVVTKLNEEFICKETNGTAVRSAGIYYTRNIDDKMTPIGLKERFPTLITDKSIIDWEVFNRFIMPFVEWAELLVLVIETIKSRHKNILMVGHAGTLHHAIPFLAKRTPNGFSKNVNGDMFTGVLAKYTEHNNGVYVYKSGKLIYESFKK